MRLTPLAAEEVDLVDAALRDEPQAVRALYARLEQLALRLACRLRPTPALDRDDFVAIGLAAAWRAIPGWEPGRGRLATYLTPRVRGEMLDALRRLNGRKANSPRRAPRHRADSEYPDGNDALLDLPDRRSCGLAAIDEADELEWRLRVLRPRERTIVLLRLRWGLTMREIGATLELSESRVSQLMTDLLARIASRDADRPRPLGEAG